MQLDCSESPGGITQILLSGRLDIAGTQAIDTRFSFITTAGAKKIVVDLSQVTFLASIGIRLLLTAVRAQEKRGGNMVFAAPQPLVRKVLESAGIDQLVELYADLDSARTRLAG